MTTIDAALELVRSLSPKECRIVAETILDVLETIDPEPLSDDDREFIDQRIKAYQANTEEARPFGEVVAGIRTKSNR